MNEDWQPVMGDLFSPLQVLPPRVRLGLAELLDEPGRAVAIAPETLGGLPLPLRPDVLTAVGRAMCAGLDEAVVARLGDCRVDAAVPALGRSGADTVVHALPERLRTVVVRHLGDADVRQLIVGEVAGWPGIAKKGAVTFVRSMVAAGLDAIAAAATDRGVAGPTLEDAVTVLVHDAMGSGEVGRAIQAVAAAGPPEVRAAAARLLSIRREDGRLHCLGASLAGAGDIRDRSVFEHLVLGLGAPATKRDVAANLGIGAERVRQLANRATERVDEALASVGFPALPDSRSRLLLRMAGPYDGIDGHPGWVAVDPAARLGETRRLLREDDGVRMLDHVAKELTTMGMVDEHVAAWLVRQPVRITDGLVVATSGSPGDVAERALHATGRPMTLEAVAAWLPAPHGDAKSAWWSDRRFVVTDDRVALAEWGTDDGVPGGCVPVPTLRIVVDHDVLAGRSGPVPRGLVGALGLRPGTHRTLSTRYGPLAVLHDGDTPTRGSVRPIALAVGAAVGDELTIAIYPDRGDAIVTVVRPVASGAALH